MEMDDQRGRGRDLNKGVDVDTAVCIASIHMSEHEQKRLTTRKS